MQKIKLNERLDKIFNVSDERQYIKKYEFYLKTLNQACYCNQNNIYDCYKKNYVNFEEKSIYAYKLELKWKIPEGYKVKDFRGTKIKDIVLIDDNKIHTIEYDFECSKYKQVILEKIKTEKINWNGGYDACKKIWDKQRKDGKIFDQHIINIKTSKDSFQNTFDNELIKNMNKNILLQKACLINGKIYNKDITNLSFNIYEINNYFGDKILDIKSLDILDSDTIELKSKRAIWLTGASGFAPKQFAGGTWVFLKDCSTDHLKAILEDSRNNKYNVEPWTIEVIKNIIKSRE